MSKDVNYEQRTQDFAGKYKGKSLFWKAQGTGYKLVFEDGSLLLGLTLNFIPDLAIKWEAREDNTIYLNENDKLKFVGDHLQLVSGDVMYPQQYRYKIGTSEDIRSFKDECGAFYRDYLFTAYPVEPPASVDIMNPPTLRKPTNFKYFASHHNGIYYYKVGDLLIGDKAYRFPANLRILGSLDKVEDYEYLVTAMGSNLNDGPFFLNDKRLMTLDESFFEEVDISSGNLHHRAK